MKSNLLDQYDWIGLGDHPAVYWAAIQYQAYGLKVLVVPNLLGDQEQGRILETNFCPRWLHPTLSVPSQNETELKDIQIITANHKIRLLKDSERWDAEWKINFGESFPDLNTHLLGKEKSDVIKGLAYAARGHDLSPLLPDDAKKMVKLARDQVWIPGGLNAIREKLKVEIESRGGQVLDQKTNPALCQQIFFDAKGFKGIQIQGTSKAISAPLCMLGVNVEWAQSLFSTESGQRLSIASEPTGWWFGLQFQLGLESLPPGLSHKMIISPKDAPVVEVEYHQGADRWMAKTLLPFQSMTLSREYQRKTAQRLFKLMEQIFPFIEYSISQLSPDLRDPEFAERVDLVQLYPFRDLAHIPLKNLAYGGKGLGHTSKIPGLSIAYEESYPRLGQFGVYHAAAMTLSEWAKKNQKPITDTVQNAVVL